MFAKHSSVTEKNNKIERFEYKFLIDNWRFEPRYLRQETLISMHYQ